MVKSIAGGQYWKSIKKSAILLPTHTLPGYKTTASLLAGSLKIKYFYKLTCPIYLSGRHLLSQIRLVLLPDYTELSR